MSLRRCNFVAILIAGLLSGRSFADPNNGWEWPDVGVECFPGSGACANITEMITWDDGTGLALYVGGLFQYAGGKPANFIARWNGQSWSSMAEGVAGDLKTMIAFDDGIAGMLFAAGSFGVSRWDGRTWTKSDEGLAFFSVQAFATFDDGLGADLYVGGGGLARWDGEKWVLIPGAPKNVLIRSMAVLDDGVKQRLYVGGNSLGNGMMYFGSWDGSTWIEVGPPPGVHPLSYFRSMATFDDGSGEKLFVSGQFIGETGNIPGMARWDGKQWTMTNAGLPPGFYASDFTVVMEGEVATLYAMGSPVDVHRWDGAKWEPLPELQGNVYAGVGFDDGGGERLHIGGKFQLDGKMPNIARRKPSGGGTPSCGDLTGDGFVNQEDLGVLLADWGCTKGVGLCPGDCDNDGDTDQSDLGIVLSNWGQPCP